MTTVIRDRLGPRRPKTTAQGIKPDAKDPPFAMPHDDRFVFEGERLFDKAACRYYVPERWLAERVNAKLERAAKITEDAEQVMGYGSPVPDTIRALKENL